MRLRPNRRQKPVVETVIDFATADALAETIAASPQAMIIALRRDEGVRDRRATLHQWRETRLACAYGRHIIVQPLADKGSWKCLSPTKGWCRGREGVLPSAATLAQPGWVEVEMAPDVADAIILRDTGALPPR